VRCLLKYLLKTVLFICVISVSLLACTILFTEYYGGVASAESNFPPGTLYPVLGISFHSSKTGWMAGYAGHIWHTSDGGKTWNSQNTPTIKSLADIQFVDTKNGWAVGYAGTILNTRDGGKTWDIQKSPLDYFWKAVYFKNQNRGWIVGERGTILNTTNGGRSWSVQLTGDDIILNAITFSPDGHGWAAGEFGVIYTTSDGNRWTLQDNGIAAKDNTLWSICYVGKGDVMAAGIGSTILLSHNYGINWRSTDKMKKAYGQGSLFRIFYFKGKIITFGHKNIFYSDNNITSWRKSVFKVPLSYNECLYDYCLKENGGAWIAGIRGSLFHTSDGIKWEKIR